MTSISTSRPLALPDAASPRRPRRAGTFSRPSLTFTGLLYVAVIVLVGLAALNSEANLLFLLFSIGVAMLLISALIPMMVVQRVQVERIAPEAVVAGRPFSLVYAVRSRRRWLRSWGLAIGEVRPVVDGDARPPRFPHAFLPVLRPGEEHRIELTGHCPRRGRVNLRGIRVLSRFPFGLFSCALDHAVPMDITVCPAVGGLRRDPWKVGRGSRSTEARAVRDHMGQDEFYGLREYREGDNLRWVHWRRSARTGELLVREMMPVRTTQLIVILDPWPEAPSAGGRRRKGQQSDVADPAVERVISAAATFICDGLERGHRVGLVCRADPPVAFGPGGGRPHRERLLRALAEIKPGGPEPLDELIANIRWSAGWQARCLICVTKFEDVHQRVARFVGRRAENLLVLSPGSSSFDALLDFSRDPSPDRRGR